MANTPNALAVAPVVTVIKEVSEKAGSLLDMKPATTRTTNAQNQMNKANHAI